MVIRSEEEDEEEVLMEEFKGMFRREEAGVSEGAE